MMSPKPVSFKFVFFFLSFLRARGCISKILGLHTSNELNKYDNPSLVVGIVFHSGLHVSMEDIDSICPRENGRGPGF